jgi:pimeloyl-ACP methyl ester carboxylesterase
LSRRSLTAALVVLALGARLLAVAVGGFDGEVTTERLVTQSGYAIVASVYRPRARSVPGAVVLCHGISASRAHMDPMARAFARRGMLVVSFDYGGHGRSQNRPVIEELNVEDVRAAVVLARRLSGELPVALLGHSMGVTSAASVSLADPGVRSLVALGQRPFVSLDQPPTLLLADGAMDPFHPYPNLRAVAEEAAGEPVAAGQTVVTASGAVRRLFLSGGCEHAGEVYDGAILGEAGGFMEAALGAARTETEPELRAPLSVSLRFVSNAAALAALLLGG